MSLDRYRMGGQPQQKIRPEHLDRAAVVYVRQSTRHQVLEHTESTRLQYALVGLVSVAVPFRRTIATAQHYASVPGQENRVTRQP